MNEYPLSQTEILHYTRLWCRQQGFGYKDLTDHPQIDDCVLLIKWQNQFGDCPPKWKKSIDRLWSYVYNHKYPLKQAHLRRLERITEAILNYRQRQQETRQKIRTLRKTHSS